MKCGEIRDMCGDYVLDIQYPKETITLYFNSRQNALNVKKIIEIDDSVPNVATVCDMQEVVRLWMNENDFCSYGKRRKK